GDILDRSAGNLSKPDKYLPGDRTLPTWNRFVRNAHIARAHHPVDPLRIKTCRTCYGRGWKAEIVPLRCEIAIRPPVCSPFSLRFPPGSGGPSCRLAGLAGRARNSPGIRGSGVG